MIKKNNKNAGSPAAPVVKPATLAAPTPGVATPTAGGLGSPGILGASAGENSAGTAGSPSASDTLGVIAGQTSVAKPNDAKFRAELEQIEQAVENLIPDGSSLSLGGQSITKDQIVGELQPTLDLFAAVDAQVKATQKARLNLRAAVPATKQFVKSLKDAVINALGRGNPELAAFGIKTGKKQAVSVAKKFVAQKKAANTRVVRNTLGKRQKQDVKFQGQLQAQVVDTTQAQGQGTGGASGTPAPAAGTNTAPAAK